MDKMPTEMPQEMGEMAESSKTVCITSNADGSFSVGDHAAYMAEEGAEMEGETGDIGEKPGMTLAASIDEALDMARQMLQDDGRSPEEAVMSGYNKGKPAVRPSPDQVFGGM